MAASSSQSSKISQNIKVVVRVRPLNQIEIDKREEKIVRCIGKREIVCKDRKFTFDHVFKPESTQMDIYLHVVAPMVEDVLLGYNCTVFAYGQTGSGKTFTMTGGDNFCTDWKEDAYAGCIPRAVANILDNAHARESLSSLNIRISYLELYNEELRDLLADDRPPKPLSIFQDGDNILLPGLKEVSVVGIKDVYELLDKGNRKRQTQATLLNQRSSRSHTVFTITVHTYDTTSHGEEILRTGKINLVDLAGSECVAKSGVSDAKECGNINKSLLTLGRVIKKLADRNNKHAPYRDSKLTRILKNSIGGNTKTCMIATISPANCWVDETLNTLEYAADARSITNAPTANAKYTKKQLLKQMSDRIHKLEKDLEIARTGQGFYVDKDDWESMNKQMTTYTSTIDEKVSTIKQLEEYREKRSKDFDVIVTQCKRHAEKLERSRRVIKKQKFEIKREVFVSTEIEKEAKRIEQEINEHLELESNSLQIVCNKLATQYLIHQRNSQRIHNALPVVTDAVNEIREDNAMFNADQLNKCDTCTDVLEKITNNNLEGVLNQMNENSTIVPRNVYEDNVETMRINLESVFQSITCEVDKIFKLSGASVDQTIEDDQQMLQEIDDEIEQLERRLKILKHRKYRTRENLITLEEVRSNKMISELWLKNVQELVNTTRDSSIMLLTEISQRAASMTANLNNMVEKKQTLSAAIEDHYKIIRQYKEMSDSCVFELRNATDSYCQHLGEQLSSLMNTLYENLIASFEAPQQTGDTPKPSHVRPRISVPARESLLQRFTYSEADVSIQEDDELWASCDESMPYTSTDGDVDMPSTSKNASDLDKPSTGKSAKYLDKPSTSKTAREFEKPNTSKNARDSGDCNK